MATKLTLAEALEVSAEARELLNAPLGPDAQEKVKRVVSAVLDVLVSHVCKGG